jgi:hypothetical protein
MVAVGEDEAFVVAHGYGYGCGCALCPGKVGAFLFYILGRDE